MTDRAIYESPARYREMVSAMPNEVDILDTIAKKALEYCSSRHEMVGLSVLDAMCGPGMVGMTLNEMGQNIEGVAVDNDPRMVEAARVSLGEGWSVLEQDILDLHLDRRFDLITINSGYHHVPDDGKIDLLKTLGTHLSDSGRIIVGENFLRRYNDSSSLLVGRAPAIEAYYRALTSFYVEERVPAEVIDEIGSIRQQDLDQDGEFKVSIAHFREHVKEAGLRIEEEARVWEARLRTVVEKGVWESISIAGSYVVVLAPGFEL